MALTASKSLTPFVLAISVSNSLACLFLPVERSQKGDSGINLLVKPTFISFQIITNRSNKTLIFLAI